MAELGVPTGMKFLIGSFALLGWKLFQKLTTSLYRSSADPHDQIFEHRIMRLPGITRERFHLGSASFALIDAITVSKSLFCRIISLRQFRFTNMGKILQQSQAGVFAVHVDFKAHVLTLTRGDERNSGS